MFGGTSLFEENKPTIPENTQIVFVSDMFAEDYQGGAELTTEALISSSPLSVFKLHSKDVTLELLEQGHQLFWVFGNYSNLDHNLIPTIVANMKYSILEYDYKYCRYRSPEKHETAEGDPCDCDENYQGKIVSAFMYGARSLWWMSEGQRNFYFNKFPFLEEKPNTVLSSVFNEYTFALIHELRKESHLADRQGWVVLDSPSWVKGADQAKKWCKDNDKDAIPLWGLPYEQVLEQLSKAEGLVYLPLGKDTCPRMVIEAKLLGCKLELNDNVQHKDELWFNTDDLLDTESYLYAARQRFWSGIKADMTYTPSISGYTTTRNCISQKYPYEESIKSMLGFCDEVVVVDGGSDDGTWKRLQELSAEFESLVVHQEVRDWNHPRFAVFDGAQKAKARSLCTKEFCWQQDSDEIVPENDWPKIGNLIKEFPPNVQILCLPVVEYWGGYDKVRMDIMPWKWRLSRNLPHITHGIPSHLRKFDESGELYAAPGTDGCDYVHAETFDIIPNINFYTQDVHQVRMHALNGNVQAQESYTNWFKQIVDSLPGVRHYSWFDLARKIRTYRDYWSSHWQSMYNIAQEDTAENNMFFDKPWAEVSDEEIDALAVRLASDTGGHIFHSKIDWNNPTPHITL